MYSWDVFISYSLLDKEWAAKLENDLTSRGLKVFRDVTRITAGDIWEKTLQTALVQSRHLVVLWSDNARNSDWIQSELKHFEIDRGEDQKRRLIPINLQGQNKALAKYEAINLLEKAEAYKKGIKDLPPALWLELLDKAEEDLKEDDLRVYTVILTSTLPRLTKVPLEYKPNTFTPRYAETLASIGIDAGNGDTWKKELEKYYGDSRSRWKPFAGAQEINQILDQLRNLIRAKPFAPQFRWRPIGDDFWSDDFDLVTREAEKLSAEFCAVIIDPLSLYDGEVLDRLNVLRQRLSDRGGISVLTPFSMSPATAHLRVLLQRSAEELYNQFYWPPFNGDKQRVHISVCEDDRDIGRLMSTLLRSTSKDTNLHPAVKQ
jgi:TIR domain